MEQDKINKIEIDNYLYIKYYNIDSFLEKVNINALCIKQDGSDFNAWPQFKKSFDTKIKIQTFNHRNIFIPLNLLFSSMEDWKIYSHMAVIENIKPVIHFQYYNVGDNYGSSDDTIVKFENSIIKTLYCIENEERITLNLFAKRLIKNIDKKELNELVETYIDRIERDITINDEIEERKDYRKQRFGNSGCNSYLNDNLDLDQQDPEFWDSI